MRRVMIHVVTAGILATVSTTVLPAHTAHTARASQLTQGVDLNKVKSTLSSPAVTSNTSVSVSPTEVKSELEDEGHLNTFSSLLMTMIVMATIAFRRTRSPKL